MVYLKEDGLSSLEMGRVECWGPREVSHKASVRVF